MTELQHIERAVAIVLELLCAACVVAAFLAVILAQPLWALLFACLAWAAFECESELDRPRW